MSGAAAAECASAGDLTATDWAVLDSIDRYLEDARRLKAWFDRVEPTQAFPERFDLERTFNRADMSYGFFGEVDLSAGRTAVMGSVQDMLYDRPRAPAASAADVAAWMHRQVREFALRYFMRVSSFRPPQAVAGESDRRYGGQFSWCPSPDARRAGFGFTQLFYKRRHTGQIGCLSEADRHAIVDLREIGPIYEWIVAKVRIFDFDVRLRPFGTDGPELVLALNEESYLALAPEFIVDAPSSGGGGTYGTGYAFVRRPGPSVFTYGPGQFEAAFELIQFRVREDGVVTAHMVFVSNRPDQIANVEIRPVDWSYRLADLATFGASSRLFAPFWEAVQQVPQRLGAFDPFRVYITLANAVTGGRAARDLCISREQLDKLLLTQHFMEHYQTVAGSSLTWRQFPDWLDASSLPEWVLSGRSS